jgi:hypothetical protein
MHFDNQPDPEKPLPKGKRRVIIALTCHEETIGDNIRRGEITAKIPEPAAEPAPDQVLDQAPKPAPKPLSGTSAAYFWHPVAVCCSEGTVTIDGTSHDVREMSLAEFVSLPGAAFDLWVKELVETNPALFDKEPVTEKKSMKS